MALSVLIVNYNTEAYIVQLLHSFCQQNFAQDGLDIIIANNVQNDRLHTLLTKEALYQKLPIRLLAMPKNVGFGRAMNAAAALAYFDTLLIINPDVILTDNNYLTKMLAFIQAQPTYGLISSQVLNDDGKDSSDRYCYEFFYKFGIETGILWFEGSLLFVPTALFRQVGGFDEHFFMYCEDEDLGLRIRQLGLPLIKNNTVSVYHKGGSSEPVKSYAFYRRWFVSKLLFMHKHLSKDEFLAFLNKHHKKSKQRYLRYRALSFMGNNANKALQAKVMSDICQEVLDSSPDCLYYK